MRKSGRVFSCSANRLFWKCSSDFPSKAGWLISGINFGLCMYCTYFNSFAYRKHFCAIAKYFKHGDLSRK